MQFHESNEEKLLRESVKWFEPEALVCQIQNKMADSGYYWIELYKEDEIRVIIVFGDNRNRELTMPCVLTALFGTRAVAKIINGLDLLVIGKYPSAVAKIIIGVDLLVIGK